MLYVLCIGCKYVVCSKERKERRIGEDGQITSTGLVEFLVGQDGLNGNFSFFGAS